MTESLSSAPVSPLRQRLIEDMELRRFSIETKRNSIRDVARFSAWLWRLPPQSLSFRADPDLPVLFPLLLAVPDRRWHRVAA